MQFRKLIKITKIIFNEIVILLLTFNVVTKNRNIFYLESVIKKKNFSKVRQYDAGVK